jgi:hypothetical protein
MNNLFLFAGILFCVYSMTDGHQNKGAMKEKNVNGTVLRQKAIRMKECSKIPLECYECFCGGKNISGKNKITRSHRTNRVKRMDPNWSRLCARCQNNYVYFTTFCESCTFMADLECAHCHKWGTTHDYNGNRACEDRKSY